MLWDLSRQAFAEHWGAQIAASASRAAPLADGAHFAVLTDVDAPDRRAVLYLAEFLEGDRAAAACRAERPSEPDRCAETEYYVRKTSTAPVTLPTAEGAVLKEKYGSLDCPGNPDGCVVTADRLAQLLAQPNAGGKETTLYMDVTVAGGRITLMVERYTP